MGRLATIICAFAALALASSNSHANPRTDYVFERIVSELVIPGFKSLNSAAQSHAAAWTSYCATPSDAGRIALTGTFHELADRWASIEMIRHGPAAEEFRREKFYFWPERKNAVERALAAVMASGDVGALTPGKLRQESAAIQGLPALERLLFGNGVDMPGLAEGSDARRRCQLGAAIAANAASLAGDMQDGWIARADIITDEAKALLATDLVTAYAVVKDVKIEAVIGADAGEVKPRAAEFWRSGRSLRNIVLNLEALNHVNALLFEVLPGDAALPATTKSAIGISQGLTAGLAELAAGPGRSDALLLRDAVDAAEDRALIEVPAALGVAVGFNSLDGD